MGPTARKTGITGTKLQCVKTQESLLVSCMLRAEENKKVPILSCLPPCATVNTSLVGGGWIRLLKFRRRILHRCSNINKKKLLLHEMNFLSLTNPSVAHVYCSKYCQIMN